MQWAFLNGSCRWKKMTGFSQLWESESLFSAFLLIWDFKLEAFRNLLGISSIGWSVGFASSNKRLVRHAVDGQLPADSIEVPVISNSPSIESKRFLSYTRYIYSTLTFF